MAWSAEQIVTYPTQEDMLAAALNTGLDRLVHCTIGKIGTEPYNTYTFNADTNKWIVHSLNRYSTDDLPTLAMFEVPIWTHIINFTTGEVIIEDGL